MDESTERIGTRDAGDTRIVAADTVPRELVRRSFVAGFRGYVVPVEPSEDQFAAMAALNDVDFGSSVLALGADDEPIAVALLAVRADDSWCAGLGVAPHARRRGLGRRLMERIIAAARECGLRRMRLEVIDGNVAARALYDALGFVPRRRLDIFGGPAAGTADEVESAPAGVVAELGDPETVWSSFGDFHPVPPAWQRDLPSLRYAVASMPRPPRGLCVGDPGRPDAYLLAQERDDGIAIFDSGCRADASSAGALSALVEDLVAQQLGRSIAAHNVPADDALNAALRARGVPVVLTQTEMALELR